MLKNLVGTTLAASVIAMSATAALAGGTAQLSPVKKATGTIEVISVDGQKWSKVKTGAFTAGLIIIMKATGKDHVLGWEILQEGKIITATGDFGTKKDKEFNKVQSVIGQANNIKLTRQAMINKCNAKLNTGGGIYQDHLVESSASFTLIAQFKRTAVLKKNQYTFDKKTSAAVPIDVKCVGVAKPKPNPPATVGTLKNNPKPTHSSPKNLRPKAKVKIEKAKIAIPVILTPAPKARNLTRSPEVTRKRLVR